MTLKQALLDLIETNLAAHHRRDGIDDRTPLIDEGLVDSLTLTEIVLLIQSLTGIEVPDDRLTPDNFASIASIETMVIELERGRAGSDDSD